MDLSLKKEIAELEKAADDRHIHPSAKYRIISDHCQAIANIAEALWPPPEPDPEPLSEDLIKYIYHLLPRIIGRLNREGDQDDHTGFFLSLAEQLVTAEQDTGPIWTEAFRANLPDGEINAFLCGLNDVLGGEPVKEVSDVWRARNIPQNVRKRLLCGAGTMIRGKNLDIAPK